MIIMFLGVLGVNFYVLYRVWNILPPIMWLRWGVVVLGVLALASMFVSILASGNFSVDMTSIMYKVGTAWFFIVLYIAMIFLVLDVLRMTHLLPVGKFMYASWAGTIGVALLTAVIFIAGNINYHNKRRVEFTVDTAGKLNRPFKAVVVSDLHLGYGIGNRELARWVEMINAEQPDMILIPGDVIDNSLRPLEETGTAAVLQGLRARDGVWVSPGNHEYISGIEGSVRFLRSAGLNVLRDEGVLVDSSLYIVGRDDRTNRERKSLRELLAPLDPDKPVVLLDHQPVGLEEPAGEGVALQVSGHTHRGQVWPISWITDAMFEKSNGLLKKGGTYIYVSSGLGIWGGKFRIGTRSEYVVVEMK